MQEVNKNFKRKTVTVKFDNKEKWLVIDILRKIYGHELSDAQLDEYIETCDNWVVTLQGE